MGTGMIYAAIVVAWAAYLVPLWLRRHDEAVAARSVDRFSSAMRVLARRPAAADERGEEPGQPVAADGELAAAAELAAAVSAANRASRVGAARRRRTLLVLVVALSAVAALTVLDVLVWWSILVPAGLLIGFLAAGARAARREREWARICRTAAGERVALSRRSAAGSASYASEPAGSAACGSGPAGDAGADDSEPTVRVRLPQPAGAVPVPPVLPGAPESDRDVWDPVPVPLPTYVTKAKAPRTVRTVNLGEPIPAAVAGPPADLAETHPPFPADLAETHPAEAAAEAVGPAGAPSPADLAETHPGEDDGDLTEEALRRPAVGD